MHAAASAQVHFALAALRDNLSMHAFTWALAAALVSAAPGALAQDALAPAVQAALASAGVGTQDFAAVAVPLHRWQRPWAHRANVPMQPGSAMKLVTAVVALDTLGIAHAGRTRLLSNAPLEAGVLAGDLVLQGGGDPDFSVAQLWQLLVKLRDGGVTTITGDLLLDRERYRPARLDIGEPPFDSRPEGWWNVTPDALLLEGGLQPVEMVSDASRVTARLMPAVLGVRVDTSQLRLSDGSCANWDEQWVTPRVSDTPEGVVVTLQGAFPRQCRRVEEMQVVDRSRYAGLMFAQIWRELGGRFDGRVREAAAPTGARVLAERRAQPWGEVLRPVIKTSDNTLTRLLFLELGVPGMAAAPQARTLDLARAAVLRWFESKGIAAPGLVVDNGSGLSRQERITPTTLARMIEWAWRSRHAPDLMMSLPVAGVDGTLRNRLKDSPAAGWGRLKTGTLRNVAALAGVAYDNEGRPWAVALMVNHEIGSAARPVLDAFIDDFARHGPYRLQAAPAEGH